MAYNDNRVTEEVGSLRLSVCIVWDILLQILAVAFVRGHFICNDMVYDIEAVVYNALVLFDKTRANINTFLFFVALTACCSTEFIGSMNATIEHKIVINAYESKTKTSRCLAKLLQLQNNKEALQFHGLPFMACYATALMLAGVIGLRFTRSFHPHFIAPITDYTKDKTTGVECSLRQDDLLQDHAFYADYVARIQVFASLTITLTGTTMVVLVLTQSTVWVVIAMLVLNLSLHVCVRCMKTRTHDFQFINDNALAYMSKGDIVKQMLPLLLSTAPFPVPPEVQLVVAAISQGLFFMPVKEYLKDFAQFVKEAKG
eukprot:764857-Hanusia_phi.AAC.1